MNPPLPVPSYSPLMLSNKSVLLDADFTSLTPHIAIAVYSGG